VYWILDIVRPQFMFGWAGAQGAFSQIVALATIAGWAVKGFGTWRFGRGRPIVVLMIGYFVWSGLSALAASNGSVALGFMTEQSKRVLMFIIAVTLVDSPSRVKTLIWVVAGSAGYLAFEMNLRYFGGFNEIQLLGYGGMDNNSMALAMVTCLAPAVFVGLYAKPLWQKALAFGAAAFIGHAILLTFSRGGMLGLLVSGVGAFIVLPKRPRYLMPMFLAFLIALRFTGPELRGRYSTAFAQEQDLDYSAQSRLELWTDCLKVMEKYPLLGAGPDHFGIIAPEFGWPAGKEAHSLWLQVGAELGVPAMVLLVLFYGLTIVRLWPVRRAGGDTDPWRTVVAFIAITSLTGFAAASQFVTMEGLETPMYIAVIAVGTLRQTRTEPSREVSKTIEQAAAARRARPIWAAPV
jgi:O-antigen ligase